MRVARAGFLAVASLVVALGAPVTATAQPVVTLPQIADALRDRFAGLQSRRGGVIGLMGYNVVPDGSANAISLTRGSSGDKADNGSPGFTLGQFGFGFTVSDDLPLYLEIYAAYARYDPRYLFSGGEAQRGNRLRWNNVTSTIGVGWDFEIAQNLYIRPILNGAIAAAAADSTMFGWLIERRTGANISALTGNQVNAWGLGGSLVLAYYDARPQWELDIELRYTQIHLETFGNTLQAARGSSIARTVTWWGRYYWPTGWEAFGRPVRWLIDTNFSWYVGNQAQAIGFGWATRVGAGIAMDLGRQEWGVAGINIGRLGLIASVLYGDRGVTGHSVGVTMSF